MGSLPARKPISQLWEWTIRKLIGDGQGGGGEENKKKSYKANRLATLMSKNNSCKPDRVGTGIVQAKDPR